MILARRSGRVDLHRHMNTVYEMQRLDLVSLIFA